MKIRINLLYQFAVLNTVLWAYWAGDLLAQAGHRIDRTANRVVVSESSQWKKWKFADGTLQISPQGEIGPSRVQKNTNAVLNIVDFLRFRPPEYLSKKEPEDIVLLDAIQGGSNRVEVINALDGDLATFWEPDRVDTNTDLSSQWWFTVDLGRVVFIKKIAVNFVAEGEGDPFLLFDVLVSDGQKPVQAVGGSSLEFFPVIQTLKPNKSQRSFEVELDAVGSDQRRAVGRFVQVVVQGSDFGRGSEITKEEYDNVPPEDQGMIEYRKRQIDGREIVVKREVYEALQPDQQGGIHYFRRERPRLAELEVWTDGDDLAGGALRRNGSISTTVPGSINPQLMIDGDVTSVESLKLFNIANRVEDELFIDLGSFFWIDSYRMSFTRFTLGNHRLEFSDGSREVDGGLKWTTAVRREQAKRSVGGMLNVDGNDFNPIKGRFFRLAYEVEQVSLPNTSVTRMSEIQLFGEGFLPEVTLESDLIRLGGSRNLVSIEWDAQTPPGTRVEVQSRTGDTLGEILSYFRNDGTPLTKQAYDKLLSIFRGEIVSEEVAGSDWEPWSAPYKDPTGSTITSPSPREFLKLRATLYADDPDVAASLSEIRLHFAEPVAQRLFGEVTPGQVDALAEPELFSIFLRPQFGAGDKGFDELLLKSPAGMELEFSGLFGGSSEEDFSPLAVDVLASSADSLHLSFANFRPGSEMSVLRLDFVGLLFSRGGLMEVSLRQGEDGEGIWQRVDSGEAMEMVDTNRLLVMGPPQNRSMFAGLSIDPPVFTPNGDGVNDTAALSFSVVLVEGTQQVKATVYDLEGRAVREMVEERAISTGLYELKWDGRDDKGVLVPPGLYVVRLWLDVNTSGAALKEESIVRTLAVVY